jgi:hypothetical protein
MTTKTHIICTLLGMCAVPASAAVAEEAQVKLAVPVMITARKDYDACGTTGVARGLDPRGDGFLAVKAGPGLRYKRIDRLYNGDQVYICGTSGRWFAIVYTRDRTDCNVSTPWARSMVYTGPCRSGWAHKRWIKLIAG